MAIDNNAAYNNRAHVPEFPQIVTQWDKDGAAYRDAMAKQGRAELNVRYGPTDRQIIDLFYADKDGQTDAPWAVFIHGGYWRALSPKEHSHLARGLTERGINVAMAGYDLSPQATLPEIIEQMRAATLFLWKRFGQRLMVYGHSAGGHLTACLMATDWTARDASAPADLVPVGCAISGVFDLTPLVYTEMNNDYKLDEASARAISPLFWPAPKGKVLDIVVGEKELPEFVRQSKA
jgi:arylformamidase